MSEEATEQPAAQTADGDSGDASVGPAHVDGTGRGEDKS